MQFTQIYDPFHSPTLSTILACLPVVVLLGLLASGRASAARAAVAGLLTAIGLALFVFVPKEAQHGSGEYASWVGTVLAAALDGAAFGLFPIGWIVLNAIFLYSLTVETGQFEIVKRSVLSLSSDRRIQALLIAFCFGAFIEGAAGFGTPVAISAALMVGAGFRPLHAAGLALIANTSPVAFGALGTPIITLAKVTKLDVLDLSAMAGRQLPFFSVVVPAWLVWVMSGWRGVLEVWPALLVCGGSFAGVQFLTANYHGPWLVDVIAGVVSMVSLAVFLRFWQPKKIWRFSEETEESTPAETPTQTPMTRNEVTRAWMPWALLTLFVFLWGLPQVKEHLDVATVSFEVPGLHHKIARTKPVVETRETEKAEYKLNILSATGTSILLTAIVTAYILGISRRQFFAIYRNTLKRLAIPLVTIACMLSLAFTTRYSGIDATLGLAFTKTGVIYPLFAAMLGWLGVALTGSDTSSNAMFGSLQTITAGNLARNGVLPLSTEQAQLLMATANSTGGVMGKMIDAQSIVVSAAATQQHGQEGAILRFVFWHSVLLALLMGGLVMIQTYLWTSVIP